MKLIAAVNQVKKIVKRANDFILVCHAGVP